MNQDRFSREFLYSALGKLALPLLAVAVWALGHRSLQIYDAITGLLLWISKNNIARAVPHVPSAPPDPHPVHDPVTAAILARQFYVQPPTNNRTETTCP